MDYNEKQLQIMEAAEQLFSQKGFDGTSVRDIAETANVNLAMISYYFGSKEKLMEALFKHKGDHFRVQLENLIQDEKLSSIQKVEKFIDDFIERILKKQHFHKIMVREQVSDSNSAIVQRIYQLKEANMALIRQLIQQGQKKGDFNKNIDVVLLMMTLVGTVSQAITSQQLYRRLYNISSQEEFEKHIKKKLGNYLKNLFKTILGNEE
jgi:AcrR family transcriptional regulator